MDLQCSLALVNDKLAARADLLAIASGHVHNGSIKICAVALDKARREPIGAALTLRGPVTNSYLQLAAMLGLCAAFERGD